MNFADNIPIYVQIVNKIKESIINNTLKEGQKLPSVREYCQIFQVTSLTMQRAIKELEGEEIITTVKGVGSFLKEGTQKQLKYTVSKTLLKEFINNMEKIGFSKEEILNKIKEEIESD